MRFCAFDVGSNTVHALVADAVDGELTDVAHYVEMPQIGVEVSRTGSIGEAAGPALAAAKRVLAQAEAHAPELRLGAATAAVRNAQDGPAFLVRASTDLGFPIHLIAEEREAQLSFLGVSSRHRAQREWVVVDLGGGSTEIVVAAGPRIERHATLRMGSGALAAKHLSDPPAAADRARLRDDALTVLRSAPDAHPEKMVVTGGTASNLPLLLGPEQPMLLTVRDLGRAERILDAEPSAAVAQRVNIEPARIHAMRGGVELLFLLLDFYGLDRFHISHAGLRHGMILAYLDRGDRWWRLTSS